MNQVYEFTGKTVDEAVTEASVQLGVSSDKFTYEVIERESNGFLGINKKLARIKVTMEISMTEKVVDFLSKVLATMEIPSEVTVSYNEEEKTLYANILGEDMGVLIGKRGQTLDSLQYLVSLVVNKESEEYIKVKLDTENYRERRKETLENLAKNISFKVKKTRKPVALEPMNPYERRIIHAALQNDKYVETHSEGEEPNRKVIISAKKGVYANTGYKKFSGNRSFSGQRGTGASKPYGQRKPYGQNRTRSFGSDGEQKEGFRKDRPYGSGASRPNGQRRPYNPNGNSGYRKDYRRFDSSNSQNNQPQATTVTNSEQGQ